MNKNMKWISGLLCLVVGMTLGSCQSDDELQSSGQTGFLISLTDEFNQKVTRTTPEKLEKPVTSQFKLRVTDADSGKEAYAGQCTESVLLKAGSYDLTATFGENPVIALDAPYYMGTKENQNVEEGKMTSVDIPCSVANALLSVTFDEESLKKAFEDYYVAVSVGSESVNVDATSGKSAYFRAGSSVELTFHGFMLGTGKEMTYDIPEPESEEESGNGSFTAIPAKTHVKVTLKFNGSVSTGAGISISKLQVDTVSIGETLPLEMMPKPKLEAEGFENNELVFAETEKDTATLHLKLSSPLQDLKMKFNFEDIQFAELNGKEYLLSKDKETIEQVLGIALPDISATDATIDFSNLIAKMQTNAGVTTRNTIEIDAKANDRWSSDIVEGQEPQNGTFTFTCNKPEFSVVVNPGNFWSKEFSIDSCDIKTGDIETISQHIQYQYRSKGEEEWINCEQLVHFEDFPTNKQYQVRAVYREGIETEPVEVELETPQQLPNSGMEDWYIEEKKKSGTWPFEDKTYYTFHPYAEGNASSSWWDTNNDKAQGGTYLFGIWYEGCFASCVSYTEDVHEGSKAALIYLSGCGDGKANSEGYYAGGAMVGSLFIGSYNSGIVQGHDFNVRPTAMSFWYKYKPYGSDAFKVVVSLKNGDKEIATGTYEPTAYDVEDGEYKQAIVDFNYVEPYEKATTVCVQFLASNKTSLSESDFAKGTTITYPVVGNWTVHMGSILKIDDIALVYDK